MKMAEWWSGACTCCERRAVSRRGCGVQAFCRKRQNLGEAGLCLADQNEIAGPPPRGARWGLTCAVSRRVPRVYIEDGRVVERSLHLL